MKSIPSTIVHEGKITWFEVRNGSWVVRFWLNWHPFAKFSYDWSTHLPELLLTKMRRTWFAKVKQEHIKKKKKSKKNNAMKDQMKLF